MADVTGPDPASLPSVAEALRHLAEANERGARACRALAEAMRDLAGLSASELRQMREAVQNVQDPR